MWWGPWKETPQERWEALIGPRLIQLARHRVPLPYVLSEVTLARLQDPAGDDAVYLDIERSYLAGLSGDDPIVL